MTRESAAVHGGGFVGALADREAGRRNESYAYGRASRKPHQNMFNMSSSMLDAINLEDEEGWIYRLH